MAKKQQNRKRPRKENVLDVKARADRIAGQRRQLWFMGILFCCLFFGIAAGAVHGWNYFYERFVHRNEAFAIRKIEIRSDGAIRHESLLEWGGIREGENLLALDLPRIKHNLELCPVVKSASIERVMPGTLKIRVAERRPLACVPVLIPRSDGGRLRKLTYYLDRDGVVMLPLDPGDCTGKAVEWSSGLPVLTRVDPAQLRLGKPVDSDQIMAALGLIRAFGKSGMKDTLELDYIDVSQVKTVEVTTSRNNRVTFGLEGFGLQLHRWRLIFEKGLEEGLEIESVDLSVANNIPALWREIEEEPATTEPVQTSYDRRSNV